MPRWYRVLCVGRLVWTGTKWAEASPTVAPRLFTVQRANAAARSVTPPPGLDRSKIEARPAMVSF